MNYCECYQQMKKIFSFELNEMKIPGSDVFIRNYDFVSEGLHEPAFQSIDDSGIISENYSFRYPVVIPGSNRKFGKAILYLHGLNERNWYKHLPGAILLAEKTGSPVCMFPLSYHINRGLPEWTDARKMSGRLDKRRLDNLGLQEASIANLSLSERLTEDPLRFFTSGFQSANDMLKLKRQIAAGHHPLFKAGTKTDIFAYSISCLMLQVLMLGDPESLMPDNRIVFFAGGSLLNKMNGVSRYIMDNIAFSRITRYFHKIINARDKAHAGIRQWFEKNRFGEAFTWMFDSGKHDHQRELFFDHFGSNLMVIALKQDTVIPLQGISSAFGAKFSRSGKLHVLDFSFPYIHENPFPVQDKNNYLLVDHAFRTVYEPVAAFFNERINQPVLRRKEDHKAAAFTR